MDTFTKAQVAEHNTPTDAWISIDDKVYNITKFAKMHPGGEKLLLEWAGKDATTIFWDNHRVDEIAKFGPRLVVGKLAGAKDPKILNRQATPGVFSTVPYAEANFFQGFRSPYYNDSHIAFKKSMREWYDINVVPKVNTENKMGKAPSKEIFQKIGMAGILACRIGVAAAPWMDMFTLPGNVPKEKFDYFHELIAHQENTTFGCPGYADGLGAGLVIGLPPVILFGQPALKAKVVPEVLKGDKRICLAITEPFAGSDVANLKCTAKLSPCGKFYIVNGCKKWITNGTFCDYFTTAVRTGGKGIKGISLLLIERSAGLETKLIKTSYSTSAGTSYITYEDVKVPVENLLGKENEGFKCIMANFNHERWLICAAANRGTRLIVEECLKWAMQRKVFGKPLMSQPVIREKLGHMIAQTEAVESWLENITYQMNNMPYKEQSIRLAGPIALLKLQTTRVALFVSDNAVQIFGGRGITQSGMGRWVEGFQRAVKYSAILGGSEEIMADLGVRQAMKHFPRNARL